MSFSLFAPVVSVMSSPENILIFIVETIFGAAPFASETIEELQLKVIDGRPIQVWTMTLFQLRLRI